LIYRSLTHREALTGRHCLCSSSAFSGPSRAWMYALPADMVLSCLRWGLWRLRRE